MTDTEQTDQDTQVAQALRQFGADIRYTLTSSAAQQDAFQRTIAQALERMATNGAPTPPPAPIIHVADRDPNFPSFNGDKNGLLHWLYSLEQIKEARQLPDDVAVRFGRVALGTYAYGLFDGIELRRWDAFVRRIIERLLPADMEQQLLAELYRHRMQGNNFEVYFSEFKAYLRYLPNIPQDQLIGPFCDGLEPTLRHAVRTANPQTLNAAFDQAWAAHRGPAPPWQEYIQRSKGEITAAVHQQLEEFSQQAGRFFAEQSRQLSDRFVQPSAPPPPPVAPPQFQPQPMEVNPDLRLSGPRMRLGPVFDPANLIKGPQEMGNPRQPPAHTYSGFTPQTNRFPRARGYSPGPPPRQPPRDPPGVGPSSYPENTWSQDQQQTWQQQQPRQPPPAEWGNQQQRPRTRSKSAENVTCYKCKQRGHYANHCPNARYDPIQPIPIDGMEQPLALPAPPTRPALPPPPAKGPPPANPQGPPRQGTPQPQNSPKPRAA